MGKILSARGWMAVLLLAAGWLGAMSLPGRADEAATGLGSTTMPLVKTSDGVVQGAVQAGDVRAFLGIPYAQPPINTLRWREPQPVIPWSGVRVTTHFGLRPMQLHPFPDQLFRSVGMSEDCLYLNVWTPATSAGAHLPVLVYIYGGGFVTGSGDEQRYDGASMARKGIVVVTMNYRLGVFGFMAHPELTAESPRHASGNYGLLDQVAALKWVQKNIAAFGGDPKKVTIGGESAGSYSVSILMASPLSKGLFAQASGESGSILERHDPESLASAEQEWAKFTASSGAPTLAALRAMPADKLMALAGSDQAPDIKVIVDGYLLPRPPAAIYEAGQQAHVPLLAGWNSAEVGYESLLQSAPPTTANMDAAIANLYGADALQVEKLYSGSTPQDAALAARDLASDRFIAYGTWNWIDTQERTGGKPVYRYLYAHPLPPPAPAFGGPALNDSSQPASSPQPLIPPGAPHASDIAYMLGNIGHYDYYAWQSDDYSVSATMQEFYANFIKTGNPNGTGLPDWPALQATPHEVMHLNVVSEAEPEQHRDRYVALKSIAQKTN